MYLYYFWCAVWNVLICCCFIVSDLPHSPLKKEDYTDLTCDNTLKRKVYSGHPKNYLNSTRYPFIRHPFVQPTP